MRWDIQLQKTGYINEAGRCLVMLANIASRPFVIVLLDSVRQVHAAARRATGSSYWLETGRIAGAGQGPGARRSRKSGIRTLKPRRHVAARSRTKPRFVATAAKHRRR